MPGPRSTLALVVLALTTAAGLAAPTPAAAADAGTVPTGSITFATAEPSSTGALRGVSCGSADFCVAVGIENQTDPYAPQESFLQVRTGGVWSRVTPAPFPSRDYEPLSVSCTSATFCAALLSPRQNGLDPYSLNWDGTAWRAVHIPSPGAGRMIWGGISCGSPTACVAVGELISADAIVPVAAGWNGSTWTGQTLPAYPVRGSSEVGLADVSCTASGSCVAVGYRRPGTRFVGAGIVARYTGTTWTWLPAVETPARRDTFLSSVSCRTAATCTAVGTSSGKELVLRLRANVWSRQEITPPIGIAAPDVACPPVGSTCLVVAAGYPDPLEGRSVLVAQVVTDTGVRDVSPTNAATESSFAGAGCVTSTSCLAVGATDIDTGQGPQFSNTLAQSWNGTRWTRETT